MGSTPAQGIRMSIFPNFATVWETMFWIEGMFAASAWRARVRSWEPIFWIRDSAAVLSEE